LERRALPSDDDVFKLHSNPNSTKIIYLDFDGHNITNSKWNEGRIPVIVAPPCDWDGDPGTFSAYEQSQIRQIWASVAEDYAPFDVDVTTEYMGEDFITRSNTSDAHYGLRVLLAPNISSWWGDFGGYSFVDIFSTIGTYMQPSVVFVDVLFYYLKYIAECTSHESGHAFGLSHQGTSALDYYQGYGAGDTSWAPIMGTGYYKNLVQWSKGEYPDANNHEDELAIITGKHLPYRADDHPDAIAGVVSWIENASSSVSGIIERTGDVDVVGFRAGAGSIALRCVLPASVSNLDVLLELLASNGTVLVASNPVNERAASLGFTTTLPNTYYYARVSGVGRGLLALNETGAYSNYGSLGTYTLAIEAPPLPTTEALTQGTSTTQTSVATIEALALTTTKALALSTTEALALTTTKALALSTTEAVALTTTEALALSTTEALALSTTKALALSTTEALALSTTEALALSTTKALAASTTEALALTTSEALASSTGTTEAWAVDNATDTSKPVAVIIMGATFGGVAAVGVLSAVVLYYRAVLRHYHSPLPLATAQHNMYNIY
jgi:hypothetical protein